MVMRASTSRPCRHACAVIAVCVQPLVPLGTAHAHGTVSCGVQGSVLTLLSPIHSIHTLIPLPRPTSTPPPPHAQGSVYKNVTTKVGTPSPPPAAASTGGGAAAGGAAAAAPAGTAGTATAGATTGTVAGTTGGTGGTTGGTAAGGGDAAGAAAASSGGGAVAGR